MKKFIKNHLGQATALSRLWARVRKNLAGYLILFLILSGMAVLIFTDDKDLERIIPPHPPQMVGPYHIPLPQPHQDPKEQK
jgi:hypothetical protein